MKPTFLLKVFQASLMCCLAVILTGCEELFNALDNPIQTTLVMTTTDVKLTVGDTYQRQATTVSPATIVYTSSDATVATVDANGVVEAIAEGEATITASVAEVDYWTAASASYKVIVSPNAPATITTAPVATASIEPNSTTALVTAGVADGGTMMYQVTATNTKPTTTDGFSATIPTAATLAAGTYYVWYYAKADAQHSDSEIAATAIEVTVTVVYAANEYNEASWDSGDKKVIFTKQTAASVTAVTNSDTDVTWGDGWYTVSGNVTINGKVTLSDNTHLILQDGATLAINGKLDCNTNNKNLYIYGQKKGDGKLIVTNSNDDGLYGSYSAGKFIEIHGGEITATTQKYALFAKGIKVYGGKITATATGSYPGIYYSSDGFDVYGGEIEATNTNTSAGSALYGISGSPSAHLTVYGGKVKGTGNGVTNGSLYGYAFNCQVMSGTTGIKFYFSDDGTTWDEGTGYASATQVGSDDATKKRYAKAE